MTAITDPDEIRIKHFEDSLAPLPFLPQAGRLLDIGCGAGFPGIPLKIERPDLEIVLLDSVGKKILFCEAVIRELGLKNIQAIHGRAEDPKIIQQLGKFDLIITRATVSMEEFLSLALPYSKPGTIAIAMKGLKEKEPASKVTGWKLRQVHDYALSNGMGQRSLYFFTT